MSKNKKNDRQRVREKMLAYLRGKSCVDCGILDIVVFEFDHVRGEKVDDVSKLMKKGCWGRVLNELTKCDVVCANCHRIRTARRNGDYKARYTGLAPGGQMEMAI